MRYVRGHQRVFVKRFRHSRVRGASIAAVRCRGVAAIKLAPFGASKWCHTHCGTLTTIPVLSVNRSSTASRQSCIAMHGEAAVVFPIDTESFGSIAKQSSNSFPKGTNRGSVEIYASCTKYFWEPHCSEEGCVIEPSSREG